MEHDKSACRKMVLWDLFLAAMVPTQFIAQLFAICFVAIEKLPDGWASPESPYWWKLPMLVTMIVWVLFALVISVAIAAACRFSFMEENW